MSIETKLRLFTALEEARTAVVEVLGARTPGELACLPAYGEGGWTVREMLTHMAALDETAFADVSRIKSGAMPVLAAWNAEEADLWNAFWLKERAHFTDTQIVEEFYAHRFALLSALTTVPDAQFEEGNFVRVLVDALAHHDQHHAAELKALTR